MTLYRCMHSIRLARTSSNRTVRRGSSLALLTVLLPVVLAIAAYAINVVYMELARTQLQINTDIATRAAGRMLAKTADRAQALYAAERMMKLNSFAHTQLSLNANRVVFGASSRESENSRYTFDPSAYANAVSIETNGKVKVPMLFPTPGVSVEFRPIKKAISTQTEIDMVLVLDRSGSMAFSSYEVAGNYNPAAAPLGWKFGLPVPPASRWLDATNSVNNFLQYLDNTVHDERVGLVTYSDGVTTDCKLSGSYLQSRLALNRYTLKFDGGATNISDGILAGAKVLADKGTARPWASRVMIVMTDGIWTAGIDPAITAQLAVGEQINIYTITFSNEADQLKMQQVATIGGGKHFHATNGVELTDAFKAIAERLPTLLTY